MKNNGQQNFIHNVSQSYVILQRNILDRIVESNTSDISILLFKFLHEIYDDKFITPSILSKRLYITRPNTSKCLDELADMEYVIKVKDHSDKRITHIKLSLEGICLVESSFDYINEVLLKKIEALNLSELSNLSVSFLTLMSLFKECEN